MDTTLPAREGNHEPVRPRLAAALALSLVCHGVAALLLGGDLGSGPAPRPPIVVTMVGREGAGGGEVSAGASTTVAASGPVEAAVAPLVPRLEPKPASRPLRRRAPRALETRTAAIEPAIETEGATRAGAATANEVDGTASGTVTGGGDEGAGAGTGTATGAGGAGTGDDGLRAFCRSCPVPDYPPRARRQGWEGTVDIGLRIGPDGGVDVATVARSSGYPVLDEVALTTARASRFAIPESGADLRGQLRYRFVLDGSAVRP